MPDDRAGFLRVSNAWWIEGKVFNALGIEINLAMLFARKAFSNSARARSVPCGGL